MTDDKRVEEPQVDQPQPAEEPSVGCLSEAFAQMGAEDLDLDAKGPPSCIVVIVKYPDGSVYDVVTGPEASEDMKRELIGVAGLRALRDRGEVVDKPTIALPGRDFQIGERGPH
ncbi:MAG TPA: hypothetical protein PKV98_18945 [Burkholderiaceae bacterium]|nr:hypothetical protein [Burkholderiaceae bacterium]